MSAALPCVVVGAGPAGLSAALWLHKLGLTPVLLERGAAVGGEVERINLPVTDYLGLPAADGRALARALRASLAAAPLVPRFQCGEVTLDATRRALRTATGELVAATVIVATGLRRRQLDVPGLAALRGHGVTDSATRDLARLAGQPVAVAGGGDGALENALLLAQRCPRVTLIHRGASLRARPEFVRRVAADPRIAVLLESRVVGCEEAGGRLAALVIAGAAGLSRLAVAGLVVKIGFAPNSELCGGTVALDGGGYIRVDRWLRTSAAGVFAAGDVANPLAPSIATAVGDGALAARAAAAVLRGEALPERGCHCEEVRAGSR